MQRPPHSPPAPSPSPSPTPSPQQHVPPPPLTPRQDEHGEPGGNWAGDWETQGEVTGQGRPCSLTLVHNAEGGKRSLWLLGGTLARRARAGHLFCDPCPTGGLLPLICWATLYGFAPWPPEHQQMF